MGVALENARLFKAEQERVAELAVINSIQQGMAGSLDFQGIVDLVGGKLREVLKIDDIGIRWYDLEADQVHYLYEYEHGERLEVPSAPIRGTHLKLIESRQPIILRSQAEMAAAGMRIVPGSDQSLSVLLVPIVASDKVHGSIIFESFEKEDAFGDSVIRLLQTVAASMGVALENARLFDETQRLYKESEQRAAELAIINSVQDALAAELSIQGIYEAVGNKIREIFNHADLAITIFDHAARLSHVPYLVEAGDRVSVGTYPFKEKGLEAHIRRTRETVVINEDMASVAASYGSELVPGTQMEKSSATVPLVVGDQVRGTIQLMDMEREHAFRDSDVRLLQTLASSMSVALENARLFDETQRLYKESEQRAAELAIINSVQQALAAKLDIQAIYDTVGNKLIDVFEGRSASISFVDPTTGLYHVPFHAGRSAAWGSSVLATYDESDGIFRIRREPKPLPDRGFAAHVLRNGKTLVINRDVEAAAVEYGSSLIPGTTRWAKSLLLVPMIVGDKVRGIVSVFDLEREDSFGDSDARLLETIAASLSSALENARLFDETQRLFKESEQRAAELAIINSVQEGLASKLEIDEIFVLVGDKVRETFAADTTYIGYWAPEKERLFFPYYSDRGIRPPNLPDAKLGRPWNSARPTERVIEKGAPLVYSTAEGMAAGLVQSPGAEEDLNQSFLGVPFSYQGQRHGVVSIQSYKPNAYDESHVRLLATLANSMSVALENARLFDETQRLYKESEQRAAELAVINSVQGALAAELNIQGIYDAVGDKIRSIFGNRDVTIRIFDLAGKQVHFPYMYEKGERIELGSRPLSRTGVSAHVIRTRETLVVNENAREVMRELGSFTVPGTGEEKSAVYVPLVSGDQVRGMIDLCDFEREHSFSESDVRLLQTLASSMSVALENARLFDETQRLYKESEQRAAELAVINSVQRALAAELNIQGIYDAVGDKIREIFANNDVGIRVIDPRTNMVHFPYAYEKGKRSHVEPIPMRDKGYAAHVFATRKTLHIPANSPEIMAEYGSYVLPGTQQTRSVVFVPLISGDQVRGLIEMADFERENAFSESDIRLLETLASTMSVALENARLFDETQRLYKESEQRAAELAIINSVQRALAAELNMQGIYDAVGDKIRELFGNADLSIRVYDAKAGRVYYPYAFEEGRRVFVDPTPLRGFTRHVVQTRETLVINENMQEAILKYGSRTLPGTRTSKSQMFVPMFAGDQVRGVIAVQDVEKEHAFSESDTRLLQTFANTMGVALENARLFDETQRLYKESEQRAAELAIINSVQQALSSKLALNEIYEAVGDKLREVFPEDVVNIRIYDRPTNTVHYVYLARREAEVQHPLREAAREGFRDPRHSHAPAPRHQREAAGEDVEFDSRPLVEGHVSQSLAMVPLVVGREAHGLLGLFNMKREHAFTDSDVRLLQTLASSMSVALENARLFDETQRLYKQSEQRAAELAIISSVQQALASQREMQAIYDAVGDKIAEIFSATDMSIRIHDPDRDTVRYPYSMRAGKARAGAGHAGHGLLRACPENRRDGGRQRRLGKPRWNALARASWKVPPPRNRRSSCRCTGGTRSGASSASATSSASTRSMNPRCACSRRSRAACPSPWTTRASSTRPSARPARRRRSPKWAATSRPPSTCRR
jgi:GAF domain-containing protein